jgi:adenylate cyclase
VDRVAAADSARLPVMGTEIERKFLVRDDSWRAGVTAQRRIVQGYVAHSETVTVRVRVADTRATLTLKGASSGISRSEFEYPVPVDDALRMLDEFAVGPVIEKVRHLVPVGSHTWEVDVFARENSGLVMAEVELAAADEPFELPTWAGVDVSEDARFFNVNLAERPYQQWLDEVPE